ncbi:hypothetical protein CI109_107083 [Kwoniella shandongensis]|uniref:Uncharacterized protein n=1 Tax=Kwoniella shandongensis TaxID=1734106 RepID=A0A5M6BT82_9TREE|nr:uncharacterized protein CI109_006491 [Kwoniella shandongensis]KAA5525222.1 hypothetical protein CI109_006491 [Kwoniella shandongensis]
MPPASRKQPSRYLAPQPSQTTASSSRQTDAFTDFQARRVQRRLDDLERTNPTDIPASSFIPEPSSSRPSLPGSPAPQSQISLQQQKKKQSGNVRRILYGKKSLKDWLDELPPDPTPPYLSAVAPPPYTPPRHLCSSCGYIGAYKCPRCAEWSCDRSCVEIHERDGGCGIGG